jgi:ketosteroid isomerase-like protein
MTPQILADRAAIQDLMLQYVSAIDDRDFTRYRNCFTSDVEISGFAPEVLRGVNAVLNFVEPAMEPVGASQHLISPSLITIDGDTAHARTDVQAMQCFKEPQGRSLTLWATYKTEFVRVAGEWKIRKHLLLPKSMRTMEAS